jgi:hypothetical protein
VSYTQTRQPGPRRGWLTNPVFVLGAGFSRAISETMPVTAQLRRGLEARLHVPVPENVEGWLSYLSSPQPFLDQAANLRNLAMYHEASRHIAETVRAASLKVRKDSEPPPWLLDFTAMVNASGAGIITFNYDDLLERCDRDIAFTTGRSGPQRRLLKLHGSITESWDPQERGSFDGPDGRASGPHWQEDRPGPYRWLEHGRWEPFIVPPVQEKSQLYDIAELRDRWRKAAELLRRASSIILLGYSLPPQDFSTHELITRAATAGVDHDLPDPYRSCPRVGVADLAPDAVIGRLESGGVVQVRRLGTGPGSIPDAIVALSNEVWNCIAAKLEAMRHDPDKTPVEFEFGMPGAPRGGIKADPGPLAGVATATDLIELIENGELGYTTFADRNPVGSDIDEPVYGGETVKVHIYLGSPH